MGSVPSKTQEGNDDGEVRRRVHPPRFASQDGVTIRRRTRNERLRDSKRRLGFGWHNHVCQRRTEGDFHLAMLPLQTSHPALGSEEIRIKEEQDGPQENNESAINLRKLYSAMQTIENRLGGGEGIEGIYGSITQTGTSKIMDAMVKSCDLNEDSFLADVGAGLCRPLVHAVVGCGVKRAVGFEVDPIKCQKAVSFISQLGKLPFIKARTPSGLDEIIAVQCTAVENLATLHEVTHMYTFWEGIPSSAKHAVGRLVQASPNLKCVAVVQRGFRGAVPEKHMLQYGFGPLELLASFPVSMGGSGRSFTSYIFSRVETLRTLNLVGPKIQCTIGVDQDTCERLKVPGKSRGTKKKRRTHSESVGAMIDFFPSKKPR